MTDDSITISPGPQFRTAMLLAIVADALQLVVFPVFVEGALSPADDLLDLGVGAAMIHLLGWHWEFCPRSSPNSCPAPIWSLSGPWRLPACGAKPSAWLTPPVQRSKRGSSRRGS